MIQQLTQHITGHPAVKHLGPGLITGAADDDPSGIATYSQAGAQLLREAFHPSAARRWPWFCT